MGYSGGKNDIVKINVCLFMFQLQKILNIFKRLILFFRLVELLGLVINVVEEVVYNY